LHPHALCFASPFHQFIAIEFSIAIFIETHRHVDEVFGAGTIHTWSWSWAWAWAWAIGGLCKARTSRCAEEDDSHEQLSHDELFLS
jgi:hypothetical protein